MAQLGNLHFYRGSCQVSPPPVRRVLPSPRQKLRRRTPLLVPKKMDLEIAPKTLGGNEKVMTNRDQ